MVLVLVYFLIGACVARSSEPSSARCGTNVTSRLTPPLRQRNKRDGREIAFRIMRSRAALATRHPAGSDGRAEYKKGFATFGFCIDVSDFPWIGRSGTAGSTGAIRSAPRALAAGG